MTDTTTTLHGIHDMPESVYFADPVPGGSLSHSGAKLILEAPAKYRHDKDSAPTDSGAAMNFGSAAHCAVLNPQDVDELVAIGDFKDWRSKASAEFKAEAVAAGRSPILAKQWNVALEMAKRVHDHPAAAHLLAECADREKSLFWFADDIEKRARVDFMGGRTKSGRYLCGDYKTASDASTRAFERAVVNFGYHSQDAFYTEGVSVLLGEADPAFLFIVQEVDAPYLVNVVQLSAELRQMGADRCRRAGEVYRECVVSGVWPGYGDGVASAIGPSWLSFQHEDDKAQWGWPT